MTNHSEKRSETIKKTARELGFEFCGISKAEGLDREKKQLEEWINKGYHGKMAYMANHFEKRTDPTKLVEGAKSVVSLLYNYFPETELPEFGNYKIARYAYGEDYHFVVKRKLKDFMILVNEKIGEINGRVFVDSAPVMERQWAARSGLGWMGKNTLLINKARGSYFFIAELIIDIELKPDGPIKDYCGSCTRCVDACPTGALEPYRLDASKCISYLTIELKDQIPDTFRGDTKNWIFGCDICQEVCPWNKFAQPHKEKAFLFNEDLNQMNKSKWEKLDAYTFSSLFKKSAVKRTKYSGLKRNISFQTDTD